MFLLVALLPVPAKAQQQQRKPPPRPPETNMLLLPAAEPTSLELLEAPPDDPARTVLPVERRHAITDLSLRLATANGEPLAAILALDNGARASRGAVLFTAELTFVVGGRMRLERGLKCGAWMSDIALCRTDCDGGAFALIRKPEVPALSMAVGRMPKRDDDGYNAGFKVDACRDEAEVTLETAIVPRKGVKVAEIELRVP